MKLLLDQNISYRLLSIVEDYYPQSTHVRLLKMTEADDLTIWNYAKTNGFTILTKDADYYDFSLLHRFPPKIIWVKSGNTSTEFLANVLLKNHLVIKAFIEKDDETGCLELYY